MGLIHADLRRPGKIPIDAICGVVHRYAMLMSNASTDLARAELIRRIAVARDRAAFAGLFEFFAPRIKAQAMRQGLSETTAEDIAQEAMLSVWQRAAQFDPARGSASAWIFTIATHARIDRLRRDKRLAAATDIDAAHPFLSVDGKDETADAARLADIVGALPAEQARIVHLSFYAELPHSEIARMLGIPLGTVKSRIRLALQKLRQVLRDEP